SDHLPSIEFYRPWIGERRVVGHLTLDGAVYTPSATAKINVAVDSRLYGLQQAKALFHEDGSFEVLADADKMIGIVSDSQRRLSALLRIGPDDSDITLPLLPAAVLSGVLVDHARDPLAGETL